MPTYQTLPSPVVPREQVTGLALGIFGHLGSPASYVAVLAVVGVTLQTAFGAWLGVSLVFLVFTLLAEKRMASLELPKPTAPEFWDGLGMVFIKGVAIGGGFVTLGWWALSHFPLWGTLSNSWWVIAAGTVGTDFGYYWIHRLMSHSRGDNTILRFYRRKHHAHHSVTALDFLRGNQSSLADTALSQFQPTLIVLSWLFGMDLAATWVAYALVLMLQATDHTSVTYNIGPLKYIFMDNHAHKLHHCLRGHLVNHAAAFSFFDRWWGTYYENWELSSNHLHLHRIPLPIKAVGRHGPLAQQGDAHGA